MIHDFIACSPLTLSGNPIASLTFIFVPTRPQAPPQPSTYVSDTFVLGSDLLHQ